MVPSHLLLPFLPFLSPLNQALLPLHIYPYVYLSIYRYLLTYLYVFIYQSLPPNYLVSSDSPLPHILYLQNIFFFSIFSLLVSLLHLVSLSSPFSIPFLPSLFFLSPTSLFLPPPPFPSGTPSYVHSRSQKSDCPHLSQNYDGTSAARNVTLPRVFPGAVGGRCV